MKIILTHQADDEWFTMDPSLRIPYREMPSSLGWNYTVTGSRYRGMVGKAIDEQLRLAQGLPLRGEE